MNFQNVLYLFLTLSVEVFGKRNKIIGGESAEIEEFPYVVSLRLISNNRHICGGTIISERHILTAAHCINDVENIHNILKVQAGSTYLSSGNSSIYNVIRAYIYTKYTGKVTYTSCMLHDIGILMLRQLIKFSNTQKRALLPIEDIKQGQHAELCGWGSLYYPANFISDQLQKTSMTIITHNQCSEYLKHKLYKQQFCGFENVGIGGCTGDSGSPLIINGTVVGISSLVVPCARGLPDVYTKVYSYLDYIKNIVRN